MYYPARLNRKDSLVGLLICSPQKTEAYRPTATANVGISASRSLVRVAKSTRQQ